MVHQNDDSTVTLVPPPPPPPQQQQDEPDDDHMYPHEDNSLVTSSSIWDEGSDTTVPTDVAQRWITLACQMDQGQELDWTAVFDALTSAHAFFVSSSIARQFCEKHVGGLVQRATAQSVAALDPQQYQSLQTCLSTACSIVGDDLRRQLFRRGQCTLLESILVPIFRTSRKLYERANVDLRLRYIEEFRSQDGFQMLHSYLIQRVHATSAVVGPFPAWGSVQCFLDALWESMVTATRIPAANWTLREAREVGAIQISRAVMIHVVSLAHDALEQIPGAQLCLIFKSFQFIFDHVVDARPSDCLEFYTFWLGFVSTLLRSPSVPLQITGKKQVNELIRAVTSHRPLPRSILCAGAGETAFNGEYHFVGSVTSEGYVQPGSEIRYVRVVTDVAAGASRELTLSRCRVQRRWFLSETAEAHNNQSRAGRGIDYYTIESARDVGDCPPLRGWRPCSPAGLYPPPSVAYIGVIAPKGRESQTLEHQLAYWIVENKVLGAAFLGLVKDQPNAFSRPILLSFLSDMCTRYRDIALLFANFLSRRYTYALGVNGFSSFNAHVRYEMPIHGPFPSFETIALETFVSYVSGVNGTTCKSASVPPNGQGVDPIQLSTTAMSHLSRLSVDVLAVIPTDLLSMTLQCIERTYSCLVETHRTTYVEFHVFWQRLSLTMIANPSRQLRKTGWDQVVEMAEVVVNHRPPPRSFVCSNAGQVICNGLYQFAGSVTQDGYAQAGTELRYVRTVPNSATPALSSAQHHGMGGGHDIPPNKKRLTLCRCTMRSQRKWWFISEVHQEHPGTDLDIDYYQHKSAVHEEAYPPPTGWMTCRDAGVHPPPKLTAIGVMAPKGEEMNTLEHHLARWMIENSILERLLRDSSPQRTSLHFSHLMSFLTSACKRHRDISVLLGVSMAERYAKQNNEM